MKAISLWEPWATLMAANKKKNETRHWPTNIRGPVALHAAKKWNGQMAAMCAGEPFASALGIARDEYEGLIEFNTALKQVLSFGAIVGVGTLVDCVKITADNYPDGDELYFGDYTPGRFMWWFTDIVRLAEPIPCRGAQGFFNLPDEITCQIVERNYEDDERLAMFEVDASLNPVHAKNKLAKAKRNKKTITAEDAENGEGNR